MILFHFETDFNLNKKQKIKEWIKECILSEGFLVGDINFVFCNDKFLIERNIQFLNHNHLTDIITFNNSEDKTLSADILISVERVKENSITFTNNFSEELNRVMIHGILHLLGYDDKTEKQKEKMRKKENIYLNKVVI